MTYETKIERHPFNGWTATTEIPLGHVPASDGDKEGERLLSVTSLRRYGGKVSTHASAVVRRFSNGMQSDTHAVFEDFSKTVRAGQVARVSMKTLAAFHADSLELLPAIIAAAKAQYGIDA